MICISLTLLPAINRPNSIASRDSRSTQKRLLDLDNFQNKNYTHLGRSLSRRYSVIPICKDTIS